MLLLAVAFAFVSCSKDEGSDKGGSPTSTLQVTVVFEPGQLGDLGYADRILRGLQTVESQNEGTIDTKYIYLGDEEKSKKAISQWASNRINPFTADKAYQRRLLVLTEATQLEWLDGVTLNENDEVLMLNTDKSVISSSALGSRIHVLNISAAASVEKYFSSVVDVCEQRGLVDESSSMGMLRWSEDQTYPDSIAETFQKHYGEQKSFDNYYFDEMLLDNSSWITVGYRLAGNFYDSDAMGFSFSIIDVGIANLGFDYYLFNDNDVTRFLYLDSDKSSINRFTICRKFDEALVNWVNQWKSGAVGSQPQEKWHGAWDGYVEDDITLY